MKKYNNKNNNFYKRLITLLSIFRRISNGKKVKNDKWLIQHKIYFSITVKVGFGSKLLFKILLLQTHTRYCKFTENATDIFLKLSKRSSSLKNLLNMVQRFCGKFKQNIYRIPCNDKLIQCKKEKNRENNSSTLLWSSKEVYIRRR